MGNETKRKRLDAKRKDLFLIEPERLTLITDKGHPLYDPRVELPPDESLVANIAMYGVLEPIIVRKNGDEIEVVAGRGRTKAVIEANRRLVAEGKPPILMPFTYRGGTDADLFGVLIAENEIRREDSMIHKGEKARKLLNMGHTAQEIAVTFGVSRQAVENWLNVQQMPAPIKEAVEAGEVSATAALQLAALPRDEQVKRFSDIKQQGEKPTVENVRSAAASPDNKPAPRMKTRKEIEAELAEYELAREIFWDGYRAALRWVLGMRDSEDE